MSKTEHPLIVIGHKNPDTDSICSAIAYAHFKKDLLGMEALPFRAGNLNLQTSFVLSHFGVESPQLITDVYPKISDIMIKGDDLIRLREEETLGHAQDVIIKRCFSFLPVVDGEGKCTGKITALRLAGLTEEIGSLCCRSENISIDLNRFVESIRGRLLTDGSLPPTFTGKPFIKGISEDSRLDGAGSFIFITPHDESEIKKAAEKGVEIIVVCGRENLSGKIVELARRKGLCLMASPQDTLSVIVRFCLAMPIRDFVDRKHPTFKHYDLVRNVQREIGKYNEGGFIVLDDEGFMRGVITRISFLNQNKFKVALVDHNEFSQAVDGIEEAEVVEIIDHHRLGNRSTDTPITFINKTVGSTSTIIAELCKTSGFTPDPKIAGLMLSAILSDTVILRSPTTTGLDKDMSKWLASRAGVDIDGFGEEMFAAGSALEGVGPEQIIKQDQKTYTEGDWKFSVSQVEMVGFRKFYEVKDVLAKKLDGFLAQEGCNFGCLMATDITKETTLLLCSGSKKVIDAITYPKVEENIFEMKGVLSRKKQVLPYLIDLMRGL